MASALAKLDWFPLYIDSLMSDEMWEQPDFVFGWYIKLLVRCARSSRRGYIQNSTDLWMLAGARSEQFFKAKNVALMARFKVVLIGDEEWLFNPKLLEVLTEQSTKLKRYPQKLDVVPLSLSVVAFDDVYKAIQRLFSFYVKVFERDARYKLTDQREKKCALRLQELMRDNGGDLEKAESTAREAIEKLSQSRWHRDNGHIDWLEQVFRSEDEFQKRLVMKVQANGQKEENPSSIAIRKALAGMVGGTA